MDLEKHCEINFKWKYLFRKSMHAFEYEYDDGGGDGDGFRLFLI